MAGGGWREERELMTSAAHFERRREWDKQGPHSRERKPSFIPPLRLDAAPCSLVYAFVRPSTRPRVVHVEQWRLGATRLAAPSCSNNALDARRLRDASTTTALVARQLTERGVALDGRFEKTVTLRCFILPTQPHGRRVKDERPYLVSGGFALVRSLACVRSRGQP
ncbi:unnamed protein product [Lampetra planeri]